MKKSIKHILKYSHFIDRIYDYYSSTISTFSHSIETENGDIFDIKRVYHDA